MAKQTTFHSAESPFRYKRDPMLIIDELQDALDQTQVAYGRGVKVSNYLVALEDAVADLRDVVDEAEAQR